MIQLVGYSMVGMVNVVIYLSVAALTFRWLYKQFQDYDFGITVTFAMFWPLFYLVLVIAFIMQILEIIRKD